MTRAGSSFSRKTLIGVTIGVLVACAFAVLVAAPRQGTAALRPGWILVYAGGSDRPAYSTQDFTALITAVDSAGAPHAWLMGGALFLEIRAASGRGFATWGIHPAATGSDWEAYIDSLLGPGGVIRRLDSAVAVAEDRVGALSEAFRVAIMIPYPDPASGSLEFGGSVYDPSIPTQRLALVRDYLGVLRSRFASAHFQHVSLYGAYWLYEQVSGADEKFVPEVATVVHAVGLQFLWIPYYRAAGFARWKALGFDRGWYQPNYFFHPGVHPLRVDSAMQAADTLGLGIEVEFDGRLFTDSPYANRLGPYITALWRYPNLRARGVAVYDGGGGLLRLARSHDPRLRDLYESLTAVLEAPAASDGSH